jgi:hypothetical protein
MFGKPTGVILLALFLIVAFTMDFYNGGMMLIGELPIPTVWNTRFVSLLWHIEPQELG